jgi:hypothetical protein
MLRQDDRSRKSFLAARRFVAELKRLHAANERKNLHPSQLAGGQGERMTGRPGAKSTAA